MVEILLRDVVSRLLEGVDEDLMEDVDEDLTEDSTAFASAIETFAFALAKLVIQTLI